MSRDAQSVSPYGWRCSPIAWLLRDRLSAATRLAIIVSTAAAFTAATTGQSPAATRFKPCPSGFSVEAPQGLSAVTTVRTVAGIRCRTALLIIRRHQPVGDSNYFREGARFSLGSYRCRVRFREGASAGEYDARARCRKGTKGFSIGFGS